jgi:hypothetical protein
VAGAVRVSSIEQDGLEDRAYRLHYNQSQNRTDVFAQVGAARVQLLHVLAQAIALGVSSVGQAWMHTTLAAKLHRVPSCRCCPSAQFVN